MTTPTSTSRNTRTEPTAFGAEDFTTGEGLRALLHRLYEGGEGWACATASAQASGM